jgi:hypothetical protein
MSSFDIWGMHVLHSDLSTHNARGSPGLVCTTEYCAIPGRVSLHAGLWAGPGYLWTTVAWMCCSWTYLDWDLCCNRACLQTGAWASPWRVYTTDSCASHGLVSSTGAWAAPGCVSSNSSTGALAAPGCVNTTESCAAPRRVYFTGALAALGCVYTSGAEFLL